MSIVPSPQFYPVRSRDSTTASESGTTYSRPFWYKIKSVRCIEHGISTVSSSTMRFFQKIPILASILSFTIAQDAPALTPPTMTLLYSMACDLGKSFAIGSVPNGQQRMVIPIIGGTFKGPRISGNPSQLQNLESLLSFFNPAHHLKQAKS